MSIIKVFGRIFGIVCAVFGFVCTILDIREMIDIGSRLPLIPDVNEFANSGIIVLTISLLLTIAGGFIFYISNK